MSENPARRRKPGLPLGTDPSFSWAEDDTLFVPFFGFDRSEFFEHPQKVRFIYESGDCARKAQEIITLRLDQPQDAVSFDLVKKYSNSALVEFLEKHLSREGLWAIQWHGQIKLQDDGLYCLLPHETWDPISVEDLLETSIQWHRTSAKSPCLRSRESLVHAKFGLSFDVDWLARTSVSRSMSAFDFFAT